MSLPILRRDELVNAEKLKTILYGLDESLVISTIAELREQAKSEKIALRDFNAAVKLAREKLSVCEIQNLSGEVKGLPECIVKIPDEYAISESGVFVLCGKTYFEVCPHPIFPVEILTDIQTGKERVRLAFKRRGVWRDDIIVDRYTLATTNSIARLVDDSIMVNDENARYLIKYLADIEMANEYYIPRKKTTSRLGWTDDGFVPYINNIEYSGNSETNRWLYKKFTEHGDISKWLDISNQVCRYTIPKIMIAAGYASLLTEKFNLNPFCVHLWGETGKGKSVSVMTSASIYGDPDIKNGIVRTGNTTSNGIEPVLDFFNNCTAYFDELTTLSQQQIQDLIYTFAQGQGKGRMTRSANAQRVYRWNNVAVFNAEFPIVTSRSKGGAANRVISMHASGNIFGDMDLPHIANTLKENYGFGAKLFINVISQPEVSHALLDLRKIYYDEIIQFTEDKQANSMSILLTAYEIARMYIYKNDCPLTINEIKPFLASKDDISQVVRAYNDFIDYVSSNYRYFNDEQINANKWGCIQDNKINIFRTQLLNFCREQCIDEKQFLCGLRDAQLLVHRENAFTNIVRFNGTVQRMVTVINKDDPDNPFI